MTSSLLNYPHNIEAEKIVLGSLMLEPDESWAVVEGILEKDDFYLRKHGTIFSAAQSLYHSDKAADIVGVREYMVANKIIGVLGNDHLYLMKLIDAVVTTALLEHYVDIVKSNSRFRKLIQCGEGISDVGRNNGSDIDAAIDKALDIFNDAVLTDSQDDIVQISELSDPFINKLYALRKGETVGLSSGYKEIDKHVFDMRGKLTIVAGYASMGKTMLMLNMARRQAAKGIRVGILSMEMTQEEVNKRVIQAAGHLSNDAILYGPMDKIKNAAMSVATLPIWIYSLGSTSISGVLRQMRQMILKYKIEVIYVDYLQLINSVKSENRSEELEAICRDLLLFTKRQNISTVAGAQINREAMKQGGDQRPHIWQLRSSGGLENTVDIVLGLFRPDYTDENAESGIIEVSFMKNRDGIRNLMLELACNTTHQRIDSLSRDEPI